jgi:hypothetical protein
MDLELQEEELKANVTPAENHLRPRVESVHTMPLWLNEKSRKLASRISQVIIVQYML